MPKTTVELETRDGRCEAHLFRPEGIGPFPGVILYMDGPGIRPGLFAMGERLAANGYFVLLPDLFYRLGGSNLGQTERLFSDPGFRKDWIAKYLPSASIANVRSDTPYFLDFLATHPDVQQPKVGTTGYCMGGGHSLTAAANHPDRVVAAASYHGGGLASDSPDSPHRFVASIRAKVYIAAADADPLFPDDMRERLLAALDAAKVDYAFETYVGERHGFAPPDTPVHTANADARHWASLLGLFDATLKPR